MRLIKVLVSFALAMIIGTAAAEIGSDIRCWTANDDLNYHMDKTCSGAEVFPISENAALAFGKMPCEKCVESQSTEIVYDDAELWMAERGGTYVLCIPSAAMQSNESLPDLEEDMGSTFTGDDAEEQIKTMMTDGARQDLDKRIEADGWVRDSFRVPELILEDDVLAMSTRQIGESWYFVIRPDKSFAKEHPMQWRIREWDIRLEEGGTLMLKNDRADERTSLLQIMDHSQAQVLFEKAYGNIDITIYRKQGINTAVIRDSDGKHLVGELFIGQSDAGITLNGYLDGKKRGTYCCVVSNEELGALVAGRIPEIRYT